MSIEAMGQQESKQKSQQITSALFKMKRDIKHGKITGSDTIAKCFSVLERYSRELEVNLSSRLQENEVDNLRQLIYSTINELKALNYHEDELDLGSIPTNSFSRGSSRRSSKNKPVKAIVDAVEEIRGQIRNDEVPKEDYERIQKELINHSHRLSTLTKKHKKHEIDAAQKLISSVSEELLTKQESNKERDSFLKEEDTSTLQVEKQTLPKIANKNTTTSFDDIENKLETLKNDIKVAEVNKDKNRLHFLAKSIQILMKDLQLIEVKNDILNEERKVLLEKNLVRSSQEVDKIKKQLVAENDIRDQTELKKKEKNQKTLQELEDIEETLIAINRGLNQQNFHSEKETFNNYINKLNSIEESCQEVSLKKAEVCDVALNLETAFTKLEMEERLTEAEWKHYQYRLDLSTFTETTSSEIFQKRKKYLHQLRDHVNQVFEVSQKIDEKKKYILYNIDNNLAALEKKAKENGRENGEVTHRKSATVTNQSLVDNLVDCFNDFEQSFSGNCTLSELKSIHNQLEDLRISLEDRLRALEYQILNEDPSSGRLVRVQEKSLDAPLNSLPPEKIQMDSIQQNLETIQAQIEESRYTKDSRLYKDVKNKLEGFKGEVVNLTNNEENRRTGGDVLDQIDNVSSLLDSNVSSRRSTTDDILIDIMSISTRVNDLGSKIQGFSLTNEDHYSIKTSLMEHQQYLKNLQIAPSKINLCKSKDDILLQIDRYLSELDNLKKNEHSLSTSEEEKYFRRELRRLKEKVSRYTGTYRNVLYQAIENDLNKCLNNVDRVFKDKNVASKVKRDIENHKMILEQKSNKDIKYHSIKENVRDEGTKELTEIKENIDSVKRELTKPKRFSKEELDKLDAKLTLSILALDSIKDENLNEEKNKLYQEINLYFGRVKELMVIKPVLNENSVQNQFNRQQFAAETIAKVQKKLEEIKPEILTFVGLETGPKFYEMDEALIGSTLKLDGLKLDKNCELFNMKVRLLKEIQKYSDILDVRVRQTEEMEMLEKEVNEMLMKIDSFNGYFGDPEYSLLDEQIIRLKVSLGKMEANPELQSRKEACIREVDGCMRKLNEAAKAVSDGFAGTLV